MTTETLDKEKQADLKVSEQMDGSVNVELPDDLAVEQDEGEKEPQEARAEGGEAGDDSHDDDHPGDTEAIRAARRARRKAKKEYVKQANAEKDIMLQNLKRQNQELMERLSVVERKTHSADLARLDKAVEDKQLRLQYARKARNGLDHGLGEEAPGDARLVGDHHDRRAIAGAHGLEHVGVVVADELVRHVAADRKFQHIVAPVRMNKIQGTQSFQAESRHYSLQPTENLQLARFRQIGMIDHAGKNKFIGIA